MAETLAAQITRQLADKGLCNFNWQPPLCENKAVAKMGVRCPNGCVGEGIFMTACAGHKDALILNIPLIESGLRNCTTCHEPMELFPFQDIG